MRPALGGRLARGSRGQAGALGLQREGVHALRVLRHVLEGVRDLGVKAAVAVGKTVERWYTIRTVYGKGWQDGAQGGQNPR